MKHVCYLLAILVFLAYACSRDDSLNSDPSLNNAGLKSAGIVIKVLPNGTDDTQAISDAFAQAIAAGHGSMVLLAEGTFHTGFLEVKEFDGVLSGSGKGTTIITNLPGLTPDAVIALNKVPALITFIGGNVSVSDLSVNLSEGLTWLGTNEMNMLLFSDYSADFTPAVKHIGVTLNNIEVTGILFKDYEVWPGGPVIDAPYDKFIGVKFAPDMLDIFTIVLRSNIDINVNRSNFSKFLKGVYVWGCKSGILDFGTKGGNVFTDNNQGLVVNENIGVNVKIWNNEFTVPPYYWNGIDLNTNESFGTYQLENVPGVLGNYNIQNNIFNINNSNGMGIMDAFRYSHREDPRWMNIIWSNNTFNSSGDYAQPWLAFTLKNALFSDNIIQGDAVETWLWFIGLYWIPDTDPAYMLSWMETSKFVNNKILSQNVHFGFDFDTKDNILMGDLTNLIVEDYGVNNKIIGKTNPNHSGAKHSTELLNRMEKIRKMYQK
jgi:hypothetical protein